MKVKEIQLINFRNFLKVSFEFDSYINIFFGENAQGKTNILESIYFLLRGYSYRTLDDKNLIYWGQEKSYLLGKVKHQQSDFQINILIQKSNQLLENQNKIQKFFKVNKKNKKKNWFVKNFNPVIFSPDDLQIIKSSPSIRRKFLDDVIINLFPIFEKHLKDYQRILFQRNILLKNKIENIDKQLMIWDRKMIEVGTIIIMFRIKTLQRLNQKAKYFHQMMTDNQETIKLIYNSNIIDQYTVNQEEIQRSMEIKLNQSKEKDYILKMTTKGPHRDDYFIMNNQINLGVFGSQGQQRTAILSLKLAALELFKEKEGEYPPLLLDDVLSELDFKRKKFLIQLIYKQKVQTFITSIELDHFLLSGLKEKIKIFQIHNGQIVYER